MPVQKFSELRNKSPAGIYVISNERPKVGPTNFKIGRTINFYKRWNGYHICWNRGYYIYCALPLNKKKYPMKTPENKKEAIQATIAIEKYIFDLLAKHNIKYTTRTHKSEWFRMTNDALAEALEVAHVAFIDDTDKPITKWKENHITKVEVDGFIEDLLTPTVPKDMPQPGSVTRAGRVIKTPGKFKDSLFWK